MKKINKSIFVQVGLTSVAILLLLLSAPYLVRDIVSAQAADVCPDGGDWVKVDGLSGQSYTYTAPEGKLVAETCYKAGTNVVYETIDPPQEEVTVNSEFQQDLSHASFRLVDEPKEDPTPTPTITATPTMIPTFTPTPTEEEKEDPTPTPTPTEEEKEELEELLLSGECLGFAEETVILLSNNLASIEWTVTNNNAVPINFSWQANNGQSGNGTAPANGSTTFMTDGDGNEVSLSYSLDEVETTTEADVEICEEEGEDPTPTPTEEVGEDPTPTPTEEVQDQPTPMPTPVDEPAGGSGPGGSSFIPLVMLGLSGLFFLSSFVYKRIKQTVNIE